MIARTVAVIVESERKRSRGLQAACSMPVAVTTAAPLAPISTGYPAGILVGSRLMRRLDKADG